MIGRLVGQLVEKNPPDLLVDVGGVGYELAVPMSTFYNLPDVGGTVTLLTHFIVREDAQLLYGFLTASERSAFRQLIKISGIGPRTALAILSGMSVSDIAQAVSTGDSALLTRIPGIGKKTAERLVLELKGKLGADLTGAAGTGVSQSSNSDIISALIALGYSEREALLTVKKLPEGLAVSDGIREALKLLSR